MVFDVAAPLLQNSSTTSFWATVMAVNVAAGERLADTTALAVATTLIAIQEALRHKVFNLVVHRHGLLTGERHRYPLIGRHPGVPHLRCDSFVGNALFADGDDG